MPQYMLLLHDSGEMPPDLSPEDIQGIIQRYVNWRKKVAASGHRIDGHKLRDGQGRVMRGKGSSRVVTDGPYAEANEDRSRWDRTLIGEGLRCLDRAAAGADVSSYHLQAGIAASHAVAGTYADTDWRQIVSQYDELLELEPSPVVALNRAIAVSRADGPRAGLAALAGLEDDPTLSRYFLFHATLGELTRAAGQPARAARHYRDALALPCSAPARRFPERKLAQVAC